MRIKRLELTVEFDVHSMHVFHTDLQPNPDPPTIIVIDGKEYEGSVSFVANGDKYDILIHTEKPA